MYFIIIFTYPDVRTKYSADGVIEMLKFPMDNAKIR